MSKKGEGVGKPTTPKVKDKKNHQEEMAKAEQVDVLVHRRGLAKGKLTRLFNYLFDNEEEEPQLSEAQIRHYLKKLDAVQKDYNDLNERILPLVPAQDLADHDQHYVQFDELQDKLAVKLEEQLAKLQATAAAPGATIATAHPQAPIIVHQPLKIPIPTFDGRYESWPKFKVMFKDLVDKTPDPPAVKLYHLDKTLMGSAAGIIDAKTISEGNYNRAWEIFEERYENKRHTIDKHIHGLLNLKRISKGTYEELRSLLDECSKHVESLKFLEQEFIGVSQIILVHVLAAALDRDIRRRWEHTVKHGDLPSYDQMMKYLKEECFTMERCDDSSTKQHHLQAKPSAVATKQSQRSLTAVGTDSESRCDFCGKGHLNYTCSEFKGLSIQQRVVKVRENNLCFNCLRKGHRGSNCPSDRTCNKCKRRHHSLLHAEDKPKPTPEEEQTTPSTQPQKKEEQQPKPSEEATSASCSSERLPTQQVLLLTAVVDIIDENQKTHPCRVLLDSASQVNLICKPMIEFLGLKRFPSNVVVAGVNNTKSHASSSCVVQIRSRHSGFNANVKCLVTERVTADLPSSTVNVCPWEIPPGIQLADPMFYETGKVDMLLGNQLFLKLLLPGETHLADHLPSLRETQLGWVVGGVCDDTMSDAVVHSHSLTLEELDRTVKRFWEIEEVAGVKLSSEAIECEQHFQETHRRDESGRYVVQLPLKENVSKLRSSRSLALKRFHNLERRLAQDPNLKQQYVEFMTEYEQLGHCEEISESEVVKDGAWYLPHHAVLRPSNTTTKCRVVFDASAKVNDLSLNDVMKIGSLNQCSLDEITLRFRIPHYVLTTDVAKMYRQVFLEKVHRCLHRVFFRLDPSRPLRVLELKTVTYGTASAPFLATRALLQVALDEGHNFPLAAEIVKNCFYVDNALFGFDDIDEAREAQSQLIHLLEAGGFHLHKWASNCPDLVEHIPEVDREELVNIEGIGVNEVIKTLGLLWNPCSDELIFVAKPFPEIAKPTKRQVLSLVASMFDPLGLAAPVIVVGKMLMKNVWSEKIDWDEELNSELVKNWEYFLKCLSGVKKIRIPRRVVSSDAIAFEIHVFGDASLEAYGACVYIRSIIPGKSHEMKMLTAKSKIVPKSVLTVPRKELLAAVLLHRLVKKVLETLKLPFRKIVLWSDSQIVLAWLKKNPEQLEVFLSALLETTTSRASQQHNRSWLELPVGQISKQPVHPDGLKVAQLQLHHHRR
ncbi:uncharacterized protein LOC135699567 [Ochlerotatus camptorhynchus]|uniref:uncharacterized protein LOC135699567 n=1 Tax=Ochlerotatus camptorhynchus TaxID=644619 RepID=UPI0031D1850B